MTEWMLFCLGFVVIVGNYFIIKTLEEIRDELRKLNGKVER